MTSEGLTGVGGGPSGAGAACDGGAGGGRSPWVLLLLMAPASTVVLVRVSVFVCVLVCVAVCVLICAFTLGCVSEGGSVPTTCASVVCGGVCASTASGLCLCDPDRALLTSVAVCDLLYV